MKERILLLGLVLILSGCGAKATEPLTTTESTTTEVSVETSQTSQETTSADLSSFNSDELLDLFFEGEIPASYVDRDSAPFYVYDISIDEEDALSYSIGDRVDLDNDGENEQIIDGAYGGIYLDARDGAVYVLAQGDGTAATLSYVEFEGQTWIVYSDTAHVGRIMYDFTLYDGSSEVDRFNLYKEFWENPNEPDGPNTVYTYRDKKINREEYDELIDNIFNDGSSEDYFYKNTGKYEYKAKFAECENVIEAEISVNKCFDYGSGILYELEIVCDKQVQDIYGDMLKLGYFLVIEDNIYKINRSDVITEMTNIDDLIKKGTLVSHDIPVKDAINSDEKGWHEYIDVKDNICEYHGYSNAGATNFYENFTWESGKGLIYYKSGFGAESYGIELTLAD